MLHAALREHGSCIAYMLKLSVACGCAVQNKDSLNRLMTEQPVLQASILPHAACMWEIMREATRCAA